MINCDNTVTWVQIRQATGLPSLTPPTKWHDTFLLTGSFLRERRKLFPSLKPWERRARMWSCLDAACSSLGRPGSTQPWAGFSAHSYHSSGPAQRGVWGLLKNVLVYLSLQSPTIWIQPRQSFPRIQEAGCDAPNITSTTGNSKQYYCLLI